MATVNKNPNSKLKNSNPNQIPKLISTMENQSPPKSTTTTTTTDPNNNNLQNAPPFKLCRYSSSARDSDAGDDIRYTSLKDILVNSPSYGSDLNDFSSDNISIRNDLVKRAASAYIRTSAISISRNQSGAAGFGGFWHRLRIKLAALRSRFCDCDCFQHIFGLFPCALD